MVVSLKLVNQCSLTFMWFILKETKYTVNLWPGKSQENQGKKNLQKLKKDYKSLVSFESLSQSYLQVFFLEFHQTNRDQKFRRKKSLINILTEDNESLFFEKTSFWSNLPSIFKVKKKLNLDSINKFGTKLESLRKRQINPRLHVLPTNTVLELWKNLLQLVLSHSKGNLLHIEVNKAREILRAKLEPPLST